jgi:hypothetical protein
VPLRWQSGRLALLGKAVELFMQQKTYAALDQAAFMVDALVTPAPLLAHIGAFFPWPCDTGVFSPFRAPP